jgi:hypothetical protein
MNLLERFHKELGGSKETLARRLMTKPWNVHVDTLRAYLPTKLYRQFCMLRSDVRSRLRRMQKNETPFIGIAVNAVGIAVQAQSPDGRFALVDGNDRVWADHIWAQIVEDLEQDGISSQVVTEDDRAAFIAFYSVAHACLFAIAGIIVPTTDGSGTFERNPDAERAHRLYWFAHYWAHQSTLADHTFILGLMGELQKASRTLCDTVRYGSHEFRFLCDYFIDKFLSLHPDYLAFVHAKDQAAIRDVTERLRLVLYVYLSTVEQQLASGQVVGEPQFDSMLPVGVHKENLDRAGFGEEAIRTLLEDSSHQPVGDRFLDDVGNGQLQVGNLSLKYALRKYCHTRLSAMKFRGEWFEQDYIANYVRERVPADRYRVFPGIKDESAKYDADVIIEDTRSRALLFCQIKHRTATTLPHLRDELKEYASNSQIQHGLEQLRNLRNRLGEPEVLERVRQRTGDRSLDSATLGTRAGFLLIHNIENLDFGTSDGIAMYEWNTLRSLMKGQISQVTKEDAKAVSIANVELDVRDPHKVMEAMLGWFDLQAHADHPTSPKHQWPLILSSKLILRIWRRLQLKGINVAPAGTLDLRFPLI